MTADDGRRCGRRQFRALQDRAREPAQDRAEIRDRRGGGGPADNPAPLAAPDATLIAVLADRAGMMLSPAAIKKYGRDLAPIRSAPARSASPSGWRRITSSLTRSAATGTRPRSTSTASSISRSRIRRCGWPTCRPGQLDLDRAAWPRPMSRRSRADKRAPLYHARARLPTACSFDVTRGKAAGSRSPRTSGCARRSRQSLDRAAINQVVVQRPVHSVEPVRGAGQPLLRTRTFRCRRATSRGRRRC